MHIHLSTLSERKRRDKKLKEQTVIYGMQFSLLRICIRECNICLQKNYKLQTFALDFF